MRNRDNVKGQGVASGAKIKVSDELTETPAAGQTAYITGSAVPSGVANRRFVDMVRSAV